MLIDRFARRSLAITFTAWAWIDEEYGWNTLPSEDNGQPIIIFYLWLFFILFNLWYPVLAVFLIIVIDMCITSIANGESSGQEHWVSPLAARIPSRPSFAPSGAHYFTQGLLFRHCVPTPSMLSRLRVVCSVC